MFLTCNSIQTPSSSLSNSIKKTKIRVHHPFVLQTDHRLSMKRKRATPTSEKPKTKDQKQRQKEEELCQIANRLIPQLPAHIVIQILSTLPIETQLICKYISVPNFAKMHLLLKAVHKRRRFSRKIRYLDLHSPPINGGPLKPRFEFTPKINIPNVSLKFVNSCNGLVCFRNTDILFGDRVYVCNPILGEYLTLPPTKSFWDDNDFGFGFGFCVQTNEYKVLRYYEQKSFDGLLTRVAEICTLGTKSWREIGVVPYTFHRMSFNTLLNGVLHWIVRDKNSSELVCGFDFGSEKFDVIPPPSQFGPDQKKNLDSISIGVLRGCLYICGYVSCGLNMWVMKNYGVKESWTKVFSFFDFERLIYPPDYYQPILIRKNGEILMLYNDNAIVSYDRVLKKFSEVQVCGIKSKFVAVAYIPSFISLNDVAKGQKVRVIKSGS